MNLQSTHALIHMHSAAPATLIALKLIKHAQSGVHKTVKA